MIRSPRDPETSGITPLETNVTDVSIDGPGFGSGQLAVKIS